MKNIIIAGLLFVCLAGYSGNVAAQGKNDVKEQSLKFQRLMALIDAFYVDTVNLQKLTEEAVIKVLADLDPHSIYISKEEVNEMNEPLEGSFFGIGIAFNIMRDTLMVVTVVPGGPSEKVGLLAGDRIVAVDGENIAGVNLSSNDVRKKLKGEKGTKVNIRVLRDAGLIDFEIIRDKIPIHSIDAAFMIDKRIGYIKISRFAATTADEFREALKKLLAKGMKDLVLDLQGNPGGYMGAAIEMCDELMEGNELIVYTDGLTAGRRDELATNKGSFKQGRVVVLIDGNSASASEIVSGALQDWDRGLIVGRRSFGKGLVQRQYPLTDGSMIRLTISHYYTPSGRCIQKPYKGVDYRMDMRKRYETGELLSADSISVVDSLQYQTKLKKRTVYGGGGIIPDLFVAIDTSVNYLYFNRLAAKNVVSEYVIGYIDNNRDGLNKKYPDFDKYNKNFVVTDEMIEDIVKLGETKNVPRDEKSLEALKSIMKLQIKALVARNLWDINEYYMVESSEDKILNEAVKALKDGTYERILK